MLKCKQQQVYNNAEKGTLKFSNARQIELLFKEVSLLTLIGFKAKDLFNSTTQTCFFVVKISLEENTLQVLSIKKNNGYTKIQIDSEKNEEKSQDLCMDDTYDFCTDEAFMPTKCEEEKRDELVLSPPSVETDEGNSTTSENRRGRKRRAVDKVLTKEEPKKRKRKNSEEQFDKEYYAKQKEMLDRFGFTAAIEKDQDAKQAMEEFLGNLGPGSDLERLYDSSTHLHNLMTTVHIQILQFEKHLIHFKEFFKKLGHIFIYDREKGEFKINCSMCPQHCLMTFDTTEKRNIKISNVTKAREEMQL